MVKDFEEIDIGRQGFSEKLMKVKMLGVVIGLKAEGVDLRAKTNESLSRGSQYRRRYHGRY